MLNKVSCNEVITYIGINVVSRKYLKESEVCVRNEISILI